MNIGSLIASIGGDLQPLEEAVKQAKQALDQMDAELKQSTNTMNANFKKIGESMKDVGKKMSLYVTLPIVAAGGYAIKMASDFNESLNKVEVAFKDSAVDVKTWAKTTLKAFGIAEGTALDMAALYGDMATSMGLPVKESDRLSMSLVGLAGDLASFKNVSIEQVNTALSGIFTGETESLKRLGIVMTEANLQAFALSQGIQKVYKDMTQAEKVQLRYAYAMSVTTNAQGDFERTGGGPANQMRIFKETLKEVSATFGQIILPLFTKILKKVNEYIQAFGKLSPVTQKLIVVFAGVAAALGPLLTILGKILTIIPQIASAGKLIAAGWGPVVAVIMAVAGAFYLVNKWQNEAVQNLQDIAGSYAKLNTLDQLKERLAAAKAEVDSLTKSTTGLDKVKGAFDRVFGGSGSALEQAKKQVQYLEKAIELKQIQIDTDKQWQEGMGAVGNFDYSNFLKGVDFTVQERIEIPVIPKIQIPENLQAYETIASTLNAIPVGESIDKFKILGKVIAEDLPMAFRNMGKVAKETVQEIKTVVIDITDVVTSMITDSLEMVGTMLGEAISSDVNNLFEALKKTNQGTKEHSKLIEEINSRYGEYLPNLLTEKSSLEEIEAAQKKVARSRMLDNVLEMFASWAIQLGKIMVAAGLAVAGFQSQILGNPFAVVGLGAALIIAGAAVRAAIASNPTSGNVSTPNYASSGSQGVDLMQSRRLQEFSVAVNGTVYVDGNQLAIVLANEEKRKGQ